MTSQPRIVPQRHDPKVREVILRPYRVVYRYRGSVVEIVTVFRGTREFPADAK
jgi:plasmid stabilization system protein ParE